MWLPLLICAGGPFLGIVLYSFSVASRESYRGTAVIIKPVAKYVPTGAVGNTVADIEEHIETIVKNKS